MQTINQAYRIFKDRQYIRDVGITASAAVSVSTVKNPPVKVPDTKLPLTQYSCIIGSLSNGDRFPRLLQGAGIIALYDGKL